MSGSEGAKRPSLLQRLKIDPYLLVLLGVIVLASFLPARGAVAADLKWVTGAAIALLFFLQGARLSREAVVSGLSAGRLHILVVAATYLLFPVLALIINALGLLPPALRPGLLFLACLPSTVQSSIACISIARGNIAAGVCAASLSNLLAVVATPFLVSLLMGAESGGFSWTTLRAIALQLLLPFVLGQIARPFIGAFVARHRTVMSYIDRGSIVLVVYGAFSHAVVDGIWKQVTWQALLILIGVCALLLGAVIAAMIGSAKALRLKTPEEIVAVICGSQKSLATGAPMAGLLFPPALGGSMILPLMVFHQIQLFTATIIAQRYGRRPH